MESCRCECGSAVGDTGTLIMICILLLGMSYCCVIYSFVTSQMAEEIVEVIVRVQGEAAKKSVVEQSINLVSLPLDESVVSHPSITI